MKILLLSALHFTKDEIEKIQRFGADITLFPSEKELVDSDLPAGAHVLIGKMNMLQIEMLEKCESLEWIHLPHIGMDRVPMEYLKKRRILVTHSRGAVGIPISEDIFCKILMLARQKKTLAMQQREHIWTSDAQNRQRNTLNLHGKTIGILGTGDVGTETAKKAKVFGMKTVGLNTSGTCVANFDEVYITTEIDRLISQSDFIVCTLPNTKETFHLVDKAQFELMKPTAYIANISRANIFNEEVLFEYLKSRKIAGAALDVFSQEPLPADNPFWDLENVIISPHCAALGDGLHERLSRIALHNIELFCKGQKDKMLNIRDYDKGY